jgi:hypothetical protein
MHNGISKEAYLGGWVSPELWKNGESAGVKAWDPVSAVVRSSRCHAPARFSCLAGASRPDPSGDMRLCVTANGRWVLELRGM